MASKKSISSPNLSSSRPSEAETLRNWLNNSTPSTQPSILGISGYGGVGKTYLLESVLKEVRPYRTGWLAIRIDGSDSNAQGNFIRLLEGKFCPKRLLAGRADEDFFPQTRKLVQRHAVLATEVETELKASGLDPQSAKIARTLFDTGAFLNKVIPRSKEFVDFEALQEKGLEKGVELGIKWLSSSSAILRSSRLPGVLKDFLGHTFDERLRTDLFNFAAEVYLSDLEAMLAKYRVKDIHKLTKDNIKIYQRLLLVIDDFEIVGKLIGEFLVSSLIPALERASFPVKIVILGRDDLSISHVGFQQHYAHCISDQIRLERFSDDVALQMFKAAGYSEMESLEYLEKSQGYPFLVSLLCEAKGGTVSFYQQFWDRTTRWLTPREREWVIPIAYLDRVDQSTVKKMIPGVRPKVVMDWFQHEASLRDPLASHYVMAPFIREMLKSYHTLIVGEELARELQERATKAVSAREIPS